MTKPELTFPLVEWMDLHLPETFSFSRCKVWLRGKPYDAEGVQYGDAPDVEVNPFEIAIK